MVVDSDGNLAVLDDGEGGAGVVDGDYCFVSGDIGDRHRCPPHYQADVTGELTEPAVALPLD